MMAGKESTQKPRRGRPPVISDEALLEAARHVFLSRGIRATTADVAERAKVSEGTIFHRYKTKDALFGAAMKFDPDDMPRLVEAMMPSPQEAEADLRATLVALGLRIVAFNRTALPLLMMSWSNPGRAHALERAGDAERAAFFARKKLAKDRRLRGLKAIFDAAIERGELGRVNSTVLTRMYLGTLRDFCTSELLADPSEGARRLPHEFVEELVELILRAAR